MAKKINISGMMDEFDTEVSIEKTQSKKQKEEGGNKGRGVANDKSKGSAWRKEERPIQKTIHFDPMLNSKISMLKTLIGNTSIEDIIYDATKEYVERMLQEKKEELGCLM